MVKWYSSQERKVGLNIKKKIDQGHLGGLVVEHLPSAQVVIPGCWDGATPTPRLHRVSSREPASPSACASASLCVSYQ